ncbi:hypothetical protein A2U01_0094952, partial [Trifolium medium]|nr:hypothetical protein [Trifolium medium]
VGRTTVSSFQRSDYVELKSLNLSHYGNNWDFADAATDEDVDAPAEMVVDAAVEVVVEAVASLTDLLVSPQILP